jgi:hypothetical protein
MTKLEDIKLAAAKLEPNELKALRAWLDELEEQIFDDRIERDIRAGKLDWLAEEALAEHRAGKTRKLP